MNLLRECRISLWSHYVRVMAKLQNYIDCQHYDGVIVFLSYRPLHLHGVLHVRMY